MHLVHSLLTVQYLVIDICPTKYLKILSQFKRRLQFPFTLCCWWPQKPVERFSDGTIREVKSGRESLTKPEFVLFFIGCQQHVVPRNRINSWIKGNASTICYMCCSNVNVNKQKSKIWQSAKVWGKKFLGL